MKRKFSFKDKIKMCHGQSLIEVIIAMAIFSLIVVSIIGLMLGSFALLTESGRFMHAENFAQEGAEAVRTILRNNWNESILNQSAVAISLGEWHFVGEGTTEQIDEFTRTIQFFPVFRNELGDIVASTTLNSYNDVQSKIVIVKIEWLARNGINNLVEREVLLSNWSSGDFVQTDWSQGDAQTIWLSDQKYDIDDGNIVATTSISLKEIATSTYATDGTLTSSAYKINSDSSFLALEWRDEISKTCNECIVKVQLKFASDSNGLPGAWTSEWVGPEGDDGDASDFFTIKTGELIAIDFSGLNWVKYKVYLEGSSTETPYLEELKIVYKK